MIAIELRQMQFIRQEQHREIASHHHMASEALRFSDQIFEVRIQFRSAAGYVDRFDAGNSERSEDLIYSLARHLFGTIGSGVDMAMLTGLIALLPDVDLKNGQARGPQFIYTMLG